MTWAATLVATAVLLTGVGFVYQSVGARRHRRIFAPPGMLVDIGGRRLHYRCAGSGTPAVIFEAGIAASSLSWSLVQPEVAKVTRACSYDRAGLAWSDPGERTRSIPGFVLELRRLLEKAAIPPPFVLVGHSFGGLIVRAFARAYPTEVAGLVFVDTLHPEEWRNLTQEQRTLLRGGVFLSKVGAGLARVGVVRLCLSLLTSGAPGIPRHFSRVFGARAAAMLEHMVGEVQKLPAEVLPAVQAHWSDPRAFLGMSQHLAALPSCAEQMAMDPDEFGDLPVVTLSATNRHPQWLDADATLAQASLRGTHLVSTRAGHWIQLDDPALVVEAIRQVVKEARKKAAHEGHRVSSHS